jgi:hypothetical protein
VSAARHRLSRDGIVGVVGRRRQLDDLEIQGSRRAVESTPTSGAVAWFIRHR